MVKLKIDDINIEVKEGTTILEAARGAGIGIPSLCYLKDINEIGACRVCIVEIDGIDNLVPSCNTVAENGMVIHTNSPRVREARKINVELILSQHDARCATCVRSGNCTLQTIANDLGIIDVPYYYKAAKTKWDTSFYLQRKASKCIKCMRCIQVCEKIQNVHIWDLEGTGSRTNIDVSHNRKIAESDCSLCGQCIVNCPVGALSERDDTQIVFDALANPDIITVVQVAPAVRTAWGESLALKPEDSTVGKMVAALKRIGFDYVFDTNFAADLTIMEEGSELLAKLNNPNNDNKPMFTSCCPAWVRFAKTKYPEIVDQISSAKSPQQMFGAVAKTYFAEKIGVDPHKLFCISIMPCLAKKAECDIPTINSSESIKDVDASLTTREFVRIIRAEHIVPEYLEEAEFDNPLGIATGAGAIFGTTGGVMEAALRSAYYLATGENPNPDTFSQVRGMDGWKEAKFDLAGRTLNIAVVHGLNNTSRLLDALNRGEVNYDFVEVMSCPGGCAGGGGQPIHDGCNFTEERGQMLYDIDHMSSLRFSHENPEVLKLYEDYLEKPLSEKAHHILHTDHNSWQVENMVK